MSFEATVKDKRFVTVMFVDICNSTQLYSRMDDEDVAGIFQNLIVECQPIIQNCGGILNQTTGDGLYAVFGADEKNDEFQGLSACIASEKIHKICPAGVSLRIGIHSGYVTSTTGEIFNDVAVHLVGKPVHVAAHICKTAQPRETLLSADAYELVKNYTLCSAVKTPLRDYTKPLYHLNRMLHYGNKFAYFRDFLSKEEQMVGRDREFADITGHIEQAFAHKSRHIHLDGEAGIGKTRMIYSVLDEIARRHANLRILSCLPLPQVQDGMDSLNLLIFEVMAHLDHYKVDADNITGVVETLQLNEKEFRHILLDVYGVEEAQAYSSSEKANIKSELILRLLTRLSMIDKVIFIIDDAHRISGDLKILFYNLQPRMDQGRFFFLTTSKRADFSNTLPEADVIRLHRLPPEDISSLIASHCADKAALSISDTEIFSKSNGNPYFATQITKFLRNAPEGIQAPAHYFQLSENLDSLFAFQLTSLEEPVLETLTCAALIGKEFSLNDLRDILQADQQDIDRHLATLSAMDLIRSYGPLSTRYEFNHEIALYAIRRSLTRSKARSMHVRILKAVRGRHVVLAGTRAQEIAYHAFHGGLYAMAYACGLVSGMQKLKQSLAGSAEDDFEIAFDAFKKLPETRNHARQCAQLQFLCAKAFSLNGYPKKALEVMADLDPEGLARRNSDGVPDPRYQELWASLKWITSNYTRADILNFERYADPKTPLGMSTALRCAGMLTDRGYFEESTQRLLTILGEFRFDNARANYGLLFPAESSCLSIISKNYAETKSFFLADQYAERALDAIADWEYTHQKIFVLTFSSFSSLQQKQYDKALSLLDEANTLTRKFSIDLIAPLVYSTHAYADYFVTKNTKNISVIEGVLQDMERRGIALRRSKYHLYLGHIYRDLGDDGSMHEHCKAAYELAKKLHEPYILIYACLMLARLYSESSNFILPVASPQTLLAEARECAAKNRLEMLLPAADGLLRYVSTN